MSDGSAPPAAEQARAVAEEADLVYVSDLEPGIRRRRSRSGFRYEDASGNLVRDEATLARIRRLAIPPAWQDVWISPLVDGHLQATGRDARGRKQYRYHPRWREVRDRTKYERMIAFGDALPRIRERTDADLTKHGLPREKVLAAVVQLLETTLIRVGNKEYARENKSFGLTTMRNRHVDVDGTSLRFEFKGKSGKHHSVTLRDRRLARIVRQCQEIRGQQLFQYLGEDGERSDITSADVNAYLRDASGEDFTAKDYRTWAGTVLASMALQETEGFASAAEAKRNLTLATERVAKSLGNTAAICRKCYIHPDLIDEYLDGAFLDALRDSSADDAVTATDGLAPEEAAVLGLLKSHFRRAKRAASSESPAA